MSADVVPATREWSAVEVAGGGEDVGAWFLSVSGEVELGNENEVPHLLTSDPPSPDPSVLSLDLTIRAESESSLRMHWKTVELRRKIGPDVYTTVRVLWQGVEVATLKV